MQHMPADTACSGASAKRVSGWPERDQLPTTGCCRCCSSTVEVAAVTVVKAATHLSKRTCNMQLHLHALPGLHAWL
jgi:hypothetical protein